MEYIGYMIGIVLGGIGMFMATKVTILNSTKNIFGFFIWGFFGWIYILSGNNKWLILMFIGLVIMAIFDYFKNKKREQAILNTVNYMINQEHYKIISVFDIDQKLDYNDVEMIGKTLNIYKSKALIPYNVDIVE